MSPTNSDARFQIAQLRIRLCSEQAGALDCLAGFYDRYADETAHEPDVIISMEHQPAGSEPWPDHPAFRSTPLGPHRLQLERFDATGIVDIDPDNHRVSARFRGAAYTNTFEAAIRIGVSVALPLHQGLLLHASAIEHEGRALLFAGPSGAGKSTIARLLEVHLPEVRRLSDELVAVTRDNGAWRAWVTPFIGGDGLPHGASAPLSDLYFLRQAPTHRATPLDRATALQNLLRTTLVYSPGTFLTERILDTALELLEAVPSHSLEFSKDPGVAQVLDIT